MNRGARVGRVGYRVEPTVTNPAWLGTLPPAELFLFGLWLPWGHGGCDLGRVLFASKNRTLRKIHERKTVARWDVCADRRWVVPTGIEPVTFRV
jgi:hypothetical protein